MDSRTHIIPRADVKGQDRFFVFFTVPGLIGTVIGAAIGYPFYAILNMFGAGMMGLLIIVLLAGIGFVIGQVKIPDTNAFPIFKKIGGEYVKDIIIRYMKFNKNKKKYVNEVSSLQTFEVSEDKLEKIVMNKD